MGLMGILIRLKVTELEESRRKVTNIIETRVRRHDRTKRKGTRITGMNAMGIRATKGPGPAIQDKAPRWREFMTIEVDNRSKRIVIKGTCEENEPRLG